MGVLYSQKKDDKSVHVTTKWIPRWMAKKFEFLFMNPGIVRKICHAFILSMAAGLYLTNVARILPPLQVVR